MKLTLIKPNMGHLQQGPYIDEGRMEPLQLGLLAGLCPPDVELTLYDDRCEAIAYEQPTDLVAITVETFTAKRAYEISARYRHRGVPVVLGGMHPTLAPREAALHADALVLGDAEPVWTTLLHDAAAKKLQAVYQGRNNDTPQPGTVPNRDLFKGRKYLPVTLTQFGRGCMNACTFCAVNVFSQQQHISRRVDEVIREIQQQDRKLVFFVDDNIVADRDAAKALFRALIPLRIQWVSQATIDIVHDQELMELMCASGCRGNVIGFESINPAALTKMRKTPNLADFNSYEKEIDILKSYHLQTWAAFIVGHDEDTPESLYALLDFALRHKFTFAAYNVLMPYPNTPWYRQLQRENRLLYDGAWWLHPDYQFNHAAFKPANMSPDELTSISFDLRKKWNSIKSIMHRFLDPRTNMASLSNMAIYWTYNPLFRKETFKKQGLRLGTGSRQKENYYDG